MLDTFAIEERRNDRWGVERDADVVDFGESPGSALDRFRKAAFQVIGRETLLRVAAFFFLHSDDKTFGKNIASAGSRMTILYSWDFVFFHALCKEIA